VQLGLLLVVDMSRAAERDDQIVHENINKPHESNAGIDPAQTPTLGAFHPTSFVRHIAPSAGGVGRAVPEEHGHEGKADSTTAAPPALSQHQQSEPVGFVRPSDLLRRPRGQSRPMPPLSAVDREQLEGLVSTLQNAFRIRECERRRNSWS